MNAAGEITEGPGFNVFAWVDGTLCTPADGVLEGVSRRTVLELAAAFALPLRIGPLEAAVLQRADEIFLSSSGGGVVAIAQLDGRPVGGRAAGDFGPVTRRLQQAYWGLHDDPRYVETVAYG